MEALIAQCEVPAVDNAISCKAYYLSATKLFAKGSEEGSPATDQYILLRRFVHLCLEVIPKHQDYATALTKDERSSLKKQCAAALKRVETLHEQLKAHFAKQVPKAQSSSVTTAVHGTAPPLSSPPSNVSVAYERGAAETVSAPTASAAGSGGAASHSHPLHRSIDDFEVLDELGQGAFGVVNRCRDKKTDECVVLKRIPYANAVDIMNITGEINLLRKLKHPSIVGYYTMFVDDNFIYLVMEWCRGGDLAQWLEERDSENGVRAVEPLVLLPFEEMSVRAMAHIHSMDVIHRDLKPSNLFLTTDPERGGMLLKIGDFGLSVQLMRKKSKASTRAGTLAYWPPEVIEGEAPSKAADVYSLGAILFELGTRLHPTSLLLPDKRLDMLGKLIPTHGAAFYRRVEWATRRDCEERLTFDMWLKDISSN